MSVDFNFYSCRISVCNYNITRFSSFQSSTWCIYDIMSTYCTLRITCRCRNFFQFTNSSRYISEFEPINSCSSSYIIHPKIISFNRNILPSIFYLFCRTMSYQIKYSYIYYLTSYISAINFICISCIFKSNPRIM